MHSACTCLRPSVATSASFTRSIKVLQAFRCLRCRTREKGDVYYVTVCFHTFMHFNYSSGLSDIVTYIHATLHESVLRKSHNGNLTTTISLSQHASLRLRSSDIASRVELFSFSPRAAFSLVHLLFASLALFFPRG